MIRRVHLEVSGRVQGVCYRMYACDEARRLGLKGWVRNRADGTVEVLAEGEDEALAAFKAWCRQGPPHAAVSGVEETPSDEGGGPGPFRIAY